MSTISVDLNIDLAPIVEPFFSQMGLSVDSLVVTSSYDEYSNVNVLNISSGALNFGSYQIVPSMNIVAIFDVNNTLIEISGLNDITNNSFGIVTEQALADSIETMYQSLVGDTSATVTDTFNVVDIVTSVIQPFLDNINTIEGYSVVSDTGGELETLVYNVVINGPNTTQLSINFGANGAEYYANADGSLDAPIGVLIPLIDSTGFSQISGSLTFSLANGLNATGYAQTNEGDIFEGVIVTNIDGSTTFSGSFSGELSVGNILNQVFGDTFSNNEIILSSQGEFQIYDLAGSAVGLYSLTNNIPTTSLNIDLSNPLVAFPDPTLLGIIQQVNPEYLITLLGVGYAEGSFTTASGHTVTGSINNMGDYEITIDNVVIMSSSDANNAYIPEGFIPPADDAIVTQALETYVNQATGQIYTVPTGGWTIPENWLRDDSAIQNSETWIDYNGIIWTEESTDRLNTIHIVSSQGDDFFIIDNTDTTIDSFTIDGTVVINGIAFTNWHSVDLIDILTGETVAYDGTAAAPSGIELSFSMVLDSQRFEEMYGVIELPFVNFIDNNGNPYEVILATGSSGTYTDVNRIIWTDTYTDYADGRIVDYSVNENGGWTQEVEVPNSDGSVDFYETDSHGSNIHFNEVSIDGLEYATGVGSYYAGNLGIVTDIQVEIVYNDSTGERSFSGTAITPDGSPIIISGANEPLLTVTSTDGTISIYDLDGKVLTFDSYIDDNGVTWMVTKTLNDDGSAYEYHTNEVNNKTKETAFDVDGVLVSKTYNDYSDSSDYESHYDYINDTHVTTDRMLDENGNVYKTIIRTREESLEIDVSPVHYLKQRLDEEGNVYRTTTEARDANGYIETLENGEIYKQQVITYGDNGVKIKTDDYYDNGILEGHIVWSYDANGNQITLEHIRYYQHLHSADSEDYLTAPNEPAHMHYRVKEFDSSGNLIRESGRKEFEGNLVQIRNVEYNADGSSTMTGAKYRADGTIYETISEDINGIRSSTVYEADGTTVKWMMEKTPASEGINVTKTYKDANGEVYRTTTIITEEGIDKDGNPVTIYSEIYNATGLVRIHNDNSNENYWGVVHQTHQHKWYIENGEKMFITEEYDASGNVVDITYTNNFGYVEEVHINNYITTVTYSEYRSANTTFDRDDLNGSKFAEDRLRPGEDPHQYTRTETYDVNGNLIAKINLREYEDVNADGLSVNHKDEYSYDVVGGMLNGDNTKHHTESAGSVVYLDVVHSHVGGVHSKTIQKFDAITGELIKTIEETVTSQLDTERMTAHGEIDFDRVHTLADGSIEKTTYIIRLEDGEVEYWAPNGEALRFIEIDESYVIISQRTGGDIDNFNLTLETLDGATTQTWTNDFGLVWTKSVSNDAVDVIIINDHDFIVTDNPYLENDTYPTATFTGNIENNGFSDEYVFTAQAGE